MIPRKSSQTPWRWFKAPELIFRKTSNKPPRQILTEGTDQVEVVFGNYQLRRYEVLLKRVASLVTLAAVRAVWGRQLADVSATVDAIPIVRKNQPLFNAQLFSDVKQSLTNFEKLLRDRQRALFESASTAKRLENAAALIDQVDDRLKGLAERRRFCFSGVTLCANWAG